MFRVHEIDSKSILFICWMDADGAGMRRRGQVSTPVPKCAVGSSASLSQRRTAYVSYHGYLQAANYRVIKTDKVVTYEE